MLFIIGRLQLGISSGSSRMCSSVINANRELSAVLAAMDDVDFHFDQLGTKIGGWRIRRTTSLLLSRGRLPTDVLFLSTCSPENGTCSGDKANTYLLALSASTSRTCSPFSTKRKAGSPLLPD